MRYRGMVLGVGIASCASVAWSQSCGTFTVQNPATRPSVLTGQVAYEDENANHQLYVYNFSNSGSSPVQVPMTDINGAAMSGAENPVFKPDGSAILFSAVTNDERDLFYWKINAGQAPINFTSSMGNHRDEDVKFSPDGSSIVWKQNIGIVTANFSLDSNGNPVLSNQKMLVAGSLGTSSETSGPVFSPDAKYVYYFLGDAAPFGIWRYDFASNSTSQAFPQDPTLTHYYPAYPDLYNFMYVSSLPPAIAACNPGCFDKIFVRARLPSVGTAWNATDCAADNSDPAPVDADHFVYSRDQNPDGNTSYELYLGEISTGKSWSLSPFGINISGGSFVGSNYTSVVPGSAARRADGLP